MGKAPNKIPFHRSSPVALATLQSPIASFQGPSPGLMFLPAPAPHLSSATPPCSPQQSQNLIIVKNAALPETMVPVLAPFLAISWVLSEGSNTLSYKARAVSVHYLILILTLHTRIIR